MDRIDLVILVIGILATWRTSAFLYYDYGPFGLMQKIRDNATGWLGKQFECFWCITLWIGLLIAPFVLWFWYPLVPIALSGATILLSNGGRIIWREMAE